MPTTCHYRDGCLCITHSGHVTSENIAKAVEYSGSHPEWDAVKCIVADLSGVDTHTLTEEDALEAGFIARAAAERHAGIRYALVADGGDLEDLVRRYIATLEGSRYVCKLFKTVEEAREWAMGADASC